jgi:hypothetical protein
VEFYSVIRKNETMSFKGKWMKLEDIVLSEVKQAHKDKRSNIFSHMWETDTIHIPAILHTTGYAKGSSLTG